MREVQRLFGPPNGRSQGYDPRSCILSLISETELEARVWWILSILTAVVLCFLPLTSVLGYESSAVMGVVLGLASMRLTAIELRGLSTRGQTLVREAPIQWWLRRRPPARAHWPGRPCSVAQCPAGSKLRSIRGVMFWVLIPLVSDHLRACTRRRYTASPVRRDWRFC